MANACKICSHDRRKEIEKQLAQGVANLRIATSFQNISEANLRNHLNHFELPAKLKEESSIEFYEMLKRHSLRLEKMLAACDEDLTDPNDETKYTLAPRADDLTVIYEVRQGKQTVRKTAPLNELIDLVNGNGRDIIRVKWTDNRYKLFLDTISELHKKLDTLAKIGGHYQKEKENESDVQKWKQAVRQLLGDETVNNASEAVELLKEAGYNPPSEKVEREIIEEIGTIG